MVSRKGFTKQALRLAKHENIAGLSLLPQNDKLAVFSVRSYWYGIIQKWADYRLRIEFADDKPKPLDVTSDNVLWDGLPVIRWFVKQLLTRFNTDKKPS
jgi:hypothetical protein